MGYHSIAGSARLAAGTLAAAALAWLVVLRVVGGMQSQPGTMGLGVLGFVGLWTVMMAAMMLPSIVPLTSLYAGDGRPIRAIGLAAGYLLVWTAAGIAAFALSVGFARLAAHSAAAGPWIGAAILVAAGLYQLTPLKHRCLSACRSPLQMLLRMGAFRGPLRHLRAGAYHGGYCLGCCWPLMVALIALGVMDLRWMAAVTVIVVLEKTWRYGERVAVATAIALILLGLLAPSHPGIIPGLHRAPAAMEPM